MEKAEIAIRYREFDPHPALRDFVACYWTMCGEAPFHGAFHRVFPDNCIDIILNFGDSWSRKDSSQLFTNPRKSYIVGTMSRPIIVELGRCVDFLGIRFRPGKAHSFFNFPVADITDQAISLEDIWGHGTEYLEDQLQGRDIHERIRVLNRELLCRYRNPGPSDPTVDAAISTIFLSGGSVPVGSLSLMIGISRQHLTRKFREHVGVGPKLLCRVVRFRRLLKRIRDGKPEGWSTVAQQLGYFDQAHLISDFREFAGLSPTEYSSEKYVPQA